MDKEEFLMALGDEGFDAGYTNGGIPTVFVDAAEEIKHVKKDLKKFADASGYTQSFGVVVSTQKSA